MFIIISGLATGWIKITEEKSMGYIFLLVAIFSELLGTSFLKASVGFSVLLPTIGALISYLVCFYFLAMSMKTVNLNVAYAIWCGIGMVLTTIIAALLWQEPINPASVLGIGLILAGTVILSMSGAGH
ncbi:DMT superfamily drug metabolite transporter [Lentilactobacillus farraginis DSM 18382 = JCM 14108]|uniref:DMT superfamily drug metabolite transporter n=1 Tax=Lentilactobacillus farraginis DSM 18382 = JCM 14108 TaxID=1423743 RepID=A0A0R1VM25_9LACO|nr:DMT superfamily drug metabolite transporter [Lentilactobacillus farraginis DSM 18382 = JCM 14108]